MLTTLSLFWFDKLSKILPHHVLAPSPSTCRDEEGNQAKADAAWESFPRSLDEYRDQLEGRSMIVRKCEVIKVEAIVRGYITGEWRLERGAVFVVSNRLPSQVPLGMNTRRARLSTVSQCQPGSKSLKSSLSQSSLHPPRRIRANMMKTSIPTRVSLIASAWRSLSKLSEDLVVYCSEGYLR